MCGTPYFVRWIFALSGFASAAGAATTAVATSAAATSLRITARRRAAGSAAASRRFLAAARVATAVNVTRPRRAPYTKRLPPPAGLRPEAAGDAARAPRHALHGVPDADLARPLRAGVRRDERRAAARREDRGDAHLVERAPLHAPAPDAAVALLRLAGAAQEAAGGKAELDEAHAPAAQLARARAAARPGHALGALPHLQVRLGAVRHVVDDLVAAELAQPLDPVGEEAVVGDAVLVDVERALAALLLVDRHAAVERLERVVDLILFVERPGGRAHAVHVGAVPSPNR